MQDFIKTHIRFIPSENPQKATDELFKTVKELHIDCISGHTLQIFLVCDLGKAMRAFPSRRYNCILPHVPGYLQDVQLFRNVNVYKHLKPRAYKFNMM